MMPTTTDEKLAEAIHDLAGSLTTFRIEAERRFGVLEQSIERRFGALEQSIERRFGALEQSMKAEMGVQREELRAFQGETRVELRWIKGIGAALLLAAFSFAGWTIAETTGLKADVRHQGVVVDALGARVKSVEGRLDKIDAKLDAVLARLPR